MNSKEIVGYVLVGVGAVAIAFSYAPVRAIVKIPLPANISDFYIMLGGAVLAGVGAWLAYRTRKQSEMPHEVPIYEGHGKERKIVGYQRLHKK